MVPKINLKDKIVCVVGLGYVGLPLAEDFSKHIKVIGFDINEKKVKNLSKKYKSFEISSDPSKVKLADFVIIAVPTPVTKSKEPDLLPVISASEIVGKHLKKNAIVVLESTVYPGVTEDIVGPILEKQSGLQVGKDFKIGYSPERINPGDKDHTLDKITKIVSGMDEKTLNDLSELYGKITTVHRAQSIKVAEAAKVIENIQRDINIALMNELSIIFSKMGIETKVVLDAASTKWNFIRYSPGLVGGHCIPVDPYYLVYKAKELGYHPQVILAGRSVNDSMAKYVAEMAIKGINETGKSIRNSKILIMGLTYKENVPDIRESPVKEIIKEFKEYSCDVYGYDPLLTKNEIKNFNVKIIDDPKRKFDCIIFTVSHKQFKKMTLDNIKKMMKKDPVIIDVRRLFDKEKAMKKGFLYKTL